MIILALTLSTALHAATDTDLLKPYPTVVRRHEVIEFKPKAGHHFSVEAPQKCARHSPVEANVRAIKCQFLKAGEAAATLNVCDDAKTFCKPVTVALQVSDKVAPDPVRLVKNETLNKDLKKILAPGFITGTPEEIRALAEKDKKPIFVMISTDWCPPCNEAKEYLLTSEAFIKATNGWLKVYVDGDSLAAVAWEKWVPYRYYPSFVLLNEEMGEVGRYNGELRGIDFVAWTEEQSRFLKDPIARLQARVLARKNHNWLRRLKDVLGGGTPDSRHADEVRLLKWAIDQNKDEIIKQVADDSRFPELQVELITYRIKQLNDETKPDQAKLMELEKSLVAASFFREDWSAAVLQLCETKAEGCVPPDSKINERLQILRDRAGLAEAEKASMMGEEYFYLAYVFDTVKDVKRRKQFADLCVGEYEKLNKLSRLKLARGAQQNQLNCFEIAERFPEAEKRLKTLVETYPSEPTFMVRMARLLKKQKKPAEALKWIEKGEGVAYGFNWFSAQLLKSELLLDLKRADEASKVIDSALDEVRITEERNNRNQVIAARLRVMQTKIQDRMLKQN
jgi:tetratricopeptide (TPR) repeat protein